MRILRIARFRGGGGSQVYFVDASLPGYQGLVSSLGEGSRVFVIENTSDAFAQMDAALASLIDPVAGLHIYSHGREGAIYLGGQWLNEAALANNASILAYIGNFLTEGGDILLYGCYTGAGVVGQSFMAQLARLTNADVAASNNLTGMGGDWVLENKTGPIESGPVQPDWNGSLAPGDPSWGIITGTAGNDSLTGFVSNDRFYGNGGNDTMTGGDGNDVYYITDGPLAKVENTQIIEKNGTNGGIDTVFSQVAYFDLGAGAANTAAANSAVEYIILQAQAGMPNQSAKGTLYDQTLMGNALDNNLTGGGGSNYLFGDAGNDNLDGGNGKLTELTYGIDYETGDRNTLVGGKGDDNYIVRNKGDSVIENLNEGIDHVYSYVNYALGANVENLTLLDGEDSTNSARLGIGNALNNVIRSNEQGNNYLDGGAGNDTLNGRIGDFLEGGDGNDLLILRNLDSVSTGNPGTVIDGSGGTDTLRFDDTRALNVNVNTNGFVGSSPNGLFAGATIGVGGTAVDLYVDGVEVVIFGKGNDTVTLVSPVANAKGSMDGGAGNDVLAFDSLPPVLGANSVLGVNMSFAATGVATVTKMSTLTTNIVASNFEHFVGTDRNDTFTATAFTFKEGNYTLDGGAGNDTIALGTVNYSAFDSAYGVELYGGTGNDSISVTAVQGFSRMSIDGGADNDIISVGSISGDEVRINGGGDDDRINVGAISSHAWVNIDGGADNDVINLTGAISGQAVVNIDGGVGNDVINLTGAISGGAFVSVNGGAGNDTINLTGAISNWASVNIDGGDGDDTITLTNLTSGMWLDGGGQTNAVGSRGDRLNLGNGNTRLVFEANGDVVSATVNGAGLNNILITDFEEINGGTGADYFDLTNYTNISKVLEVDGTTGNDTIVLGQVSVEATGRLMLDGGDKGTDMLYLNGTTGQSLTFTDNQGPSLSYYNAADTSAATTAVSNLDIWDFEYYKGNNTANNFDANAYTHTAGNLVLEGGTGHDMLILGNVTGGNITLRGGAGDDRYRIGNVSVGTVVVDDALDGEWQDKLTFTGDRAINMSLAANGNISAISMGGGKVNITATGIARYEGTSGNDIINASAVTSVDNSAKTMYLYGGAGNDTITAGKITGGGFVLEGGTGADVCNLQASHMKATVTGTAGDGDDKVNLFGVSASTSGSGVTALNNWSGLVFKKDASGNVLMSFAGTSGAVSDTNILTFQGVAGQDTLSFYSAQTEATRLFGGDVDLDQLYGFITSGGNGWDDGSWHGVTFVANGTSYEANAVKT